MHRYRAYSLNISSEISLPELRSSISSRTDVVIRRKGLAGPASGEVYGSDAFHTRVRGVGLFYLNRGRELIVDPEQGAAEAEVRTALLGPILSALLRQRGMNVLHASSVVIEGRAVVFIGPQRAGKSTMAHACHACGHAVMADDVTGIVSGERAFHVVPGYSQIKLNPETAEALLENGDELPWLLPTGGKRITAADERFPAESFPLERIYVLRTSDRLGTEPLSARDALLYLLKNSRGIPPLQTREYMQVQLQQCTELVRHVSAAVLRRPEALDAINDVVALVERDLTGGKKRASADTPEVQPLIGGVAA